MVRSEPAQQDRFQGSIRVEELRATTYMGIVCHQDTGLERHSDLKVAIAQYHTLSNES